MPFVPGANVLEIDAIYTQYSERVENVFYVQGTAAWTETTINAALDNYSNWETMWGAARRGDNVNLVLLVGRDLTTQTSTSVEKVESIQGTDGGAHLPNNVTIAVKHQTALRGRSFRGRTYWIGLTATRLDVTGNLVTPTEAGRLVDAMEALRTSAWPNGGVMGVFSRRHQDGWRAAGVFTPIERFLLTDLFIDSQRRRLPAHNVHR